MEANRPLVVAILHKEFSHKAPLSLREDLISEGMDGLDYALTKFDFSRGVKFGTYATYWVRQRIYKYLANSRSLIRISREGQEAYQYLRLAEETFVVRAGHAPRNWTELAKFLGCEASLVRYIYRCCRPRRIDSLDAPINEDGEGERTRWEVHIEREVDPVPIEEVVEHRAQTRLIMEAIRSLEPRDQQIILLKAQGYSLGEIVKEVGGFTRQRAEQIVARIVRELRAQLGVSSELPVEWVGLNRKPTVKQKREVIDGTLVGFVAIVKGRCGTLSGQSREPTRPKARVRNRPNKGAGKESA